MVVVMWMRQSRRFMGDLTDSSRHRVFGWVSTALMAVAVAVLFVTAQAACAAAIPVSFSPAACSC
jgi:hypothetical protein